MVARDGVEPPTPAFSGLYSPVAKYHANNHLGGFHFPFCSSLLEAQRKHNCGKRCLPLKLVIRSPDCLFRHLAQRASQVPGSGQSMPAPRLSRTAATVGPTSENETPFAST